MLGCTCRRAENVQAPGESNPAFPGALLLTCPPASPAVPIHPVRILRTNQPTCKVQRVWNCCSHGNDHLFLQCGSAKLALENLGTRPLSGTSWRRPLSGPMLASERIPETDDLLGNGLHASSEPYCIYANNCCLGSTSGFKCMIDGCGRADKSISQGVARISTTGQRTAWLNGIGLGHRMVFLLPSHLLLYVLFLISFHGVCFLYYYGLDVRNAVILRSSYPTFTFSVEPWV
jgi:hypothetical protein